MIIYLCCNGTGTRQAYIVCLDRFTSRVSETNVFNVSVRFVTGTPVDSGSNTSDACKYSFDLFCSLAGPCIEESRSNRDAPRSSALFFVGISVQYACIHQRACSYSKS
jgi:hypothetical protein